MLLALLELNDIELLDNNIIAWLIMNPTLEWNNAFYCTRWVYLLFIFYSFIYWLRRFILVSCTAFSVYSFEGIYLT